MNILITNDDGIHAEGIAVLAEAARAFGRVYVAAPASQCSAMSHRITITRAMAVEAVDFPIPVAGAWSVDGTPADCVRAALDVILPEKPDVVLSGVNHGFNVGYEIMYSGTVGAAMEGLMNGIPAIAVSSDVHSWMCAQELLPQILEKLLHTAPPAGRIWNVNFPAREAKGILWDRTPAPCAYFVDGLIAVEQDGKTAVQYPDELTRADSPRGPEGSDLNAVLRGFVSVGSIACPVL